MNLESLDIAGIIVALGVLVTAITGLIIALRGVKKEVSEVHAIVNSRSTDQLARIDQLTQVITSAIPGAYEPPALPSNLQGQGRRETDE